MVQPVESYGSLLQHFTGSKHHNIALREYALKKGLSLSEYGIRNIKTRTSNIKQFSSEENFYNYLGMDWIPPELREDSGEIEGAVSHNLPDLLKISDVKADLQIHSDFDIETSHDLGESSMEDLVEKADILGYEYIAFTEHNPSKSRHNEKQILEILKRKKARIEQLNYSIVKSKFKCIKYVFNSLEIDLSSDGERSIPDSAMELLDFALVSIHSNFDLSTDKMTKRVLTGLNHPKAKIFAHPTARKLNEREGVELNWPEIFEFAVKFNKWIEINADPMRLDLPDNLVRDAVGKGVKLTLGTDAHHADMMDNMIYGVYVGRRGWAERSDIINTNKFADFKNFLERG
jgi:DNA polymerase (family 10)